MRRWGIYIGLLLLPLLTRGQVFVAENHDNEYVELSWQGFAGEVSIGRRFSDEAAWQEIARVGEGPFRDTIRRSLCQDTISYRLVHEEDTLFAQAPFTDDQPTGMPEVRFCSVDSLTQRLTLQWGPSPDADLWGYVLCARHDEVSPWLAVDTLWGADQSAAELDFSPLQPHYFRIYAFDSCLTASAMTEPVGNMVLALTHNETTGQVEASWSAFPCHQVEGDAGYDVEVVAYAEGQEQPTTMYQHVAQNQLSFSVSEGTELARVTVLAALRQARSNTVEAHFSWPEPPPPPPAEEEEDTLQVPTRVWVPNAFTPSMPSNNRFCVSASGLSDYSLTLYDRMGRPLFHSTDPAACWDGRLPSGVEAPVGAYLYHLRYQNHHGDKLIQTGTFLLLR